MHIVYNKIYMHIEFRFFKSKFNCGDNCNPVIQMSTKIFSYCADHKQK